MHQFFVDDAQIGRDFITVTGPDVNHIKNVLRMKPGEAVRVSSSGGRDFLCSVLELADEFVQLDIMERDIAGTELCGKVYLFQALPKGDRMDTVVQKAVELGVYEIIPVAMRYCVVKLDEKKAAAKVKRWQAVALSAAKQSKRSLVPRVHEVMDFESAVLYAMECDRRLVPYENERGMAAAREALLTIKKGESVSVMIGPEGGFSGEEIERVRGQMQAVSLGRRILRTDTAALAALSVLMLYMESLDDKER